MAKKAAAGKTDFPHGANETIKAPGDLLTTYLERHKELTEGQKALAELDRELKAMAEDLRKLPELRTLLVVETAAPAAPAAPGKKPGRPKGSTNGAATKTTKGPAKGAGTIAERALAYIQKHGPISPTAVAEAIGTTSGQISTARTEGKLVCKAKENPADKRGILLYV